MTLRGARQKQGDDLRALLNTTPYYPYRPSPRRAHFKLGLTYARNGGASVCVTAMACKGPDRQPLWKPGVS